jgi:hypothetical protein
MNSKMVFFWKLKFLDNGVFFFNSRISAKNAVSCTFHKQIQSTSESRTVPAFEWSFWTGPDHLIVGTFETRTSCPWSSLDRFIKKSVIKNIYSCQNGLGLDHLKAGLSCPAFKWSIYDIWYIYIRIYIYIYIYIYI